MTRPYLLEVADAHDWLMTPREAQLAILDPPFPGMERHVHRGTTTRLVGRGWMPTVSYEYIIDLFDYLWHSLDWDSHVYMFTDQDLAFHVVPAIAEGVFGGRKRDGGWTFWKALIWEKAGKPGGGYHYRAQHEMILFFEKGKRKLEDLSLRDVLHFPRVSDPLISTQKPTELLETLIRASSNEGDLVIDCFSGSGSTAEACIRTGRRFAGCDVDPAVVRLAEDRLELLMEKVA